MNSLVPTTSELRSVRSARTLELEVPRAVGAQFDRLRFEQGWIEAEFLASFRAGTLDVLRRTMKVVLTLQLAWAPFDWYVAPAAVNLLWPLRYGVTCPLLLGFLFLSRSRSFERVRNAALMTISLVLCASAITITMIAGPNGHLYYFPGLILATFGCATSPGHRFRSSTTLNIGMFVAYELAINFVGETTSAQILTNTIWLVWANLASMSAAYAIERQLRAEFWQRRIIREQSDELQRAIRKVEESRMEVERISRIDPLTGLFNRRHFFGEARRGSGGVALLILDVDHFKSVNDQFGHTTGDRILKEVADRIKANIRANDVACRYGGEEFAILLPEADLRTAALVAERIRQGVEAAPFDVENRPQDITISVGVATVDHRDSGIEALIDRADKALYQAKHAGRNCVKVACKEPKSSMFRSRMKK